MAVNVTMPRLGPAMDRGKIIEWLKREGDIVAQGDPLVIVEAEKVTVEIEAKTAGTLAKIIAQPGEEKEVGEPLCVIAAPGEALSSLGSSTQEQVSVVAGPGAAEACATPAEPTPSARSQESTAIKALPVARKLAELHGVDLRDVKGSGPQGRICKEDVEAFLAAREAVRQAQALTKPAAVASQVAEASGLTDDVRETLESWGLHLKSRIPLTGMRGQIADSTQKSWQTAPQGTQFADVDASELLRLRARLLSSNGGKVSVTAIIVRALGAALEENPLLNALVIDRQILLIEDINIGVAVSVDDEGGLVVPVIRQANRLKVAEISDRIADLSERARTKRLSLGDVSGGTFTISNLGMFNVGQFTPVLNPPQTGILGVSALTEKALVSDGQLVIRPVLPISLTMDHRAVDGVPGARFLSRVKELMENPYLLL